MSSFLQQYLGNIDKLTIVKSFDIAYLSVLQFVFAILVNVGLDKITVPDQEKLDEHENIISDFLFLCLFVSLLVLLAYVGRHIIQKIPSPFDLLFGFKHNHLPELTEISTITSFILLTSGYIEMRIRKIRNYFGLNTKFFNIANKKENGSVITK